MKISKSNSLHKQNYTQKPPSSINAQEPPNKWQHPLMIKNTEETRGRRDLPQDSKRYMRKQETQHQSERGKTESIAFKSATGQGCPLLTRLLQIILEILSRAIRPEKEI